MLVVFAALLPIFLLIALGFLLKRSLLTQDAQWSGIEHIVYYVLFPALLIETLARADLASVPVAGAGGALLLAVVIVLAICFALRPLLSARFGISGATFSSILQGASRWQTYVALAVSASLGGARGLALASVAMVAMVPLLNVVSVWALAHYAAPRRLPWTAVLLTIARNPLIWACAVGLALNLSHLPLGRPVHEFIDALGRASLATGLLCVGAGLHLEGLLRIRLATLLAVVLKLVVLPLVATALARAFGVDGTNLAIVTCCAAVPASSSSYVLARQMGGDAPLLAQVLTLQTIAAAITMPLFIAWVTP